MKLKKAELPEEEGSTTMTAVGADAFSAVASPVAGPSAASKVATLVAFLASLAAAAAVGAVAAMMYVNWELIANA